MWTDADGVRHAVALPNPSEVMNKPFLNSLIRLSAEKGNEVLDWAQTRQDQLLNRAGRPCDDEAWFVGQTPPVDLLAGAFHDLDGLVALVEAVDRRWLLDALLAIEDLTR